MSPDQRTGTIYIEQLFTYNTRTIEELVSLIIDQV